MKENNIPEENVMKMLVSNIEATAAAKKKKDAATAKKKKEEEEEEAEEEDEDVEETEIADPAADPKKDKKKQAEKKEKSITLTEKQFNTLLKRVPAEKRKKVPKGTKEVDEEILQWKLDRQDRAMFEQMV